MFLGVSNTIDEKSENQLDFTEGYDVKFVLYCGTKKAYVSVIRKDRMIYTGNITKARMFKSRQIAEEKSKNFQQVIGITNTEKGIILV